MVKIRIPHDALARKPCLLSYSKHWCLANGYRNKDQCCLPYDTMTYNLHFNISKYSLTMSHSDNIKTQIHLNFIYRVNYKIILTGLLAADLV